MCSRELRGSVQPPTTNSCRCSILSLSQERERRPGSYVESARFAITPSHPWRRARAQHRFSILIDVTEPQRAGTTRGLEERGEMLPPHAPRLSDERCLTVEQDVEHDERRRRVEPMRLDRRPVGDVHARLELLKASRRVAAHDDDLAIDDELAVWLASKERARPRRLPGTAASCRVRFG